MSMEAYRRDYGFTHSISDIAADIPPATCILCFVSLLLQDNNLICTFMKFHGQISFYCLKDGALCMRLVLGKVTRYLILCIAWY